MACPITRSLVLNFTPPSPAPANGYRVKWRVVGTTQYTTASGSFTSSPITLTGIPACENIEGTIESSCSVSSFSAPATFSANKITALVCGSNISRTSSSTVFYTYPKELIDLNGVTATTVDVQWVTNDVPNRINVYDSNNNLLVTTGWKGNASYSGPWGASLSTATSGTLTFDRTAGDGRYFTLNAEYAGSSTTTDNWQATIACGSGGGENQGGGGSGTPGYTVTPSVTSVNEGGTVNFVITTTNVANGTVLYYTMSGSVVDGDFTDNTTAGSITINNNTATISKTLKADTTTEGTETFTLSLRTGNTAGPVVFTTSTITVNDTSTTPQVVTFYNVTRCDTSDTGVIQYNGGNNLTAGVVVKSNNGNCYTIGTVSNQTSASSGVVASEESDCSTCLNNGVPVTPTYAITPSTTSVNEGGTVTFNVTTTNVGSATLYWVVNGGVGLGASDFADNTLSGNVVITNNSGSFTRTIASDSTTEGSETFTVALKTGSTSGTTVATSSTITIGDTSTTPPTTYKIGVAVNAAGTETVNCLGTDYTAYKEALTATLYDNTGVVVNATSNITVTFKTTYTPCVGSPSDNTRTVVIPAGQSSATSSTWYETTTVDCGQYGCTTEQETYSCVVSNSASYNWNSGTTTCSGS